MVYITSCFAAFQGSVRVYSSRNERPSLSAWRLTGGLRCSTLSDISCFSVLICLSVDTSRSSPISLMRRVATVSPLPQLWLVFFPFHACPALCPFPLHTCSVTWLYQPNMADRGPLSLRNPIIQSGHGITCHSVADAHHSQYHGLSALYTLRLTFRPSDTVPDPPGTPLHSRTHNVCRWASTCVSNIRMWSPGSNFRKASSTTLSR